MRRYLLILGLLAAGCVHPRPVFAQANAQNTRNLTAVDQCLALDVAGMGTGVWQVAGTFVGTITWTVSANAGDFVLIDATTPAAGTSANSTTTTGAWTAPIAGFRQMRACMTAYTSGTATVTLSAAATGGAGSSGGGSGGGTQYTEGSTDASITGTATMFEDAADTLRAASATYPFPVTVISGSAFTQYTEADVDASITGNAVMFETAGNVLRDLVGSAPADNMTMPAYAPFVIAILGCGHDGGDVDLCPQGDAGSGVLTANTTRTIFATDAPGFGTEDLAETASGQLFMAGSVRRDVAAASSGTTGDNSTVNTDALGLLWTRQLDPCSGVAKTPYVFSISSATTTEITGPLSGASNYYYVCSINLTVGAANNVALVDDDTDGCGSVTSGLAGGTSAATGWNFAANGGLTLGNGLGTVAKTNGTNRVLCLVTSGTAQTSGTIMVAAAP